MDVNDRSPSVPNLGPISCSSIFQRRASKESLLSSYIKFEDYDNLSLLSLNENSFEIISYVPNYDRKVEQRYLLV